MKYADHLQEWACNRDPLRTRHGLAPQDYGSALTIYMARKAAISPAVMYLMAGALIGLAVGLSVSGWIA